MQANTLVPWTWMVQGVHFIGKPGTRPFTLQNLSTKEPSSQKTVMTKRSKCDTSNKTMCGRQIDNTEPYMEKRETRKQKRVYYADLNLCIDTSKDKSPPRKYKQSKAIALHEPSQAVIAVRNERLTRRSLQCSEHEKTKLIGTVIITPSAKEIKHEEVKTEQD